MKASILVLAAIFSHTLAAKEFNAYEDIGQYHSDKKWVTKEKVYEDKISYLERELSKYKAHLIEKSLALENAQDQMKFKYDQEIAMLKREMNYKTKSLLEAQRQIEKFNPPEDMKNLIRVNNELAAQLRQSADQLAISQLKTDKSRMPASVKAK